MLRRSILAIPHWLSGVPPHQPSSPMTKTMRRERTSRRLAVLAMLMLANPAMADVGISMQDVARQFARCAVVFNSLAPIAAAVEGPEQGRVLASLADGSEAAVRYVLIYDTKEQNEEIGSPEALNEAVHEMLAAERAALGAVLSSTDADARMSKELQGCMAIQDLQSELVAQARQGLSRERPDDPATE